MKFGKIPIWVIFLLVFSFALIAIGGEVNSPKNIESSSNQGQEKRPSPVKLVVLDPGHGGYDSGAVGPKGVLEKDLVLEVSKRLKVTIEKRLPIKVILTREEDVFIPLKERSDIANRLGADVFISIHANAARRGGWGFETYFLSATASDDESRALALMENYPQEPPPGLNQELPPDVSDEVGAILFDMAQTEYIKESEALAMIIQDRLATALESPNRGVKQAPFNVLMGAATPAVLVEIGFVSSRKEVKYLTDPAMQEKIADALALSIGEFAKRRAMRIGGNSHHAPGSPGGS